MLPTGTVTLLFTDIEGSTPLWEQMPADMQLAVAQHHAILRSVIEARRGQVFQILGDAFQAAFSLATVGLCAAIEAQRAMQSADWGATGPLKVRMGLHTGPIELDPIPAPTGVQEYAVCHTLNRAARVMSAGHGGQILISQETKSLIERHLPEGVHLRDLGEHLLKGLRRSEHLYQVIATGLRQDFPALVTGIVHPNNLPLEITSFVGREKEIAELKEMLTDRKTRLVTVMGAGGMGKTRLALRVAGTIIDTYTDGVWLVELASLSDPAFVPQAVAQVLSVRELPGRPVMEILQEHLSKKKLLLILDNCEHLIHAAADLTCGLLRTCPHLQILATSREILGVEGETSFPCPSLLSPDLYAVTPTAAFEVVAGNAAVRLFSERAASAIPSFRLNEKNAATIATICQRLDGIPLAIELAAARIRLLSVEQIATRLDDAFHLLTTGARTALPRHQTLKALIDWSYNLLTPAEQTLLLRLSVFTGGWDLPSAEAVATGDGIDAREVINLMAQLVDKSLIRVEPMESGENRYRMLETIRKYAHDLLMEKGEHPAVYKRFLEYFSRMAKQAAPHLWDKEQGEWMRRLLMEIDNLRGALGWALNREMAEENEVELGTQLVSSLWYFWYLSGALKEVGSWLGVALQRSARPNPTRANLLMAIGTFAWQQGDLSMAVTSLRESLDLYYVLEDTPGIAEATHLYGHVVFDQQNYAEAERIFKESLSLYESLGDTNVRIALISDLGLVACHQGDLRSARSYYEESLALCIQNGLKDGEAQTFVRLGDISRLEGDYERADEFYQRSLLINRDLKIMREIACSLQKLAFTTLYRGEISQAQALFRESLMLQHEAGNQQGIAEYLAGLASVGVHSEKYEDAARYFGAARQILTRTGLPMSPADLAEWQRDEETGRTIYDPQRFELAWSNGLEESLDELITSLLNE
jgi:predicted ATPase/class 3 adenylate cyclase/Tfp pilus assembly protein PilF